MLEPGIDVTAAPPQLPQVIDGIDPRGWATVMLAMCVIGLISFRSSPMPRQPARIEARFAEEWMADALPGIGPKTRAEMAQRIKAGPVETLPTKAQAVARQVFTWPAAVRSPSGSSGHPAP